MFLEATMKKTYFITIAENTQDKVGMIRGVSVSAGSLHQAVTKVAKMMTKAQKHLEEREQVKA